jgi:uncharacterized protein (TIGR02391 family)
VSRDAAKWAVELARRLQAEHPPPTPDATPDLKQFDALVTDDGLRSVTRKLFIDGHYAQSVEEGFKFLNNLVKRLSGLSTDDGASMMTKAFSANTPRLKLSKEVKSQTAKDRQNGYMRLFEGSMVGIRNPRAHTAAHPDDDQTAMELLTLCNHLVRVTRGAVRTRQRKRKAP